MRYFFGFDDKLWELVFAGWMIAPPDRIWTISNGKRRARFTRPLDENLMGWTDEQLADLARELFTAKP